MKRHILGKRENLREVREVKESEGKLKKVPTIEAREARTPDDLNLAIAERLHARTPYNAIAGEFRVSPRTISRVTKMIDTGTIKIAENGKATYCRNSELMELGPLPTQLQMEILGAAHLEGKSTQDVIARLIRMDRKIRLKELTLEQLERAAEFVKRAFSCGWTIDQLIDIMTRLENSGLSKLDQQSLGLLPNFLESAKRRNLKPEHIIQIAQRTEDERRKEIHDSYENGYNAALENYTSWLVDIAARTYGTGNAELVIRMFRSIVNPAWEMASNHTHAPPPRASH